MLWVSKKRDLLNSNSNSKHKEEWTNKENIEQGKKNKWNKDNEPDFESQSSDTKMVWTHKKN